MKRFLFAVSLCACLGTVAAAQSKEELKKTYSDRYDLIVSKLGYDGVGVETVLNQWEDWYVVRVDGLVGWASADLITLI